ncbi:MAG: phosphotransferase [bacterium]|nr:phosphotransferase [bacterium]
MKEIIKLTSPEALRQEIKIEQREIKDEKLKADAQRYLKAIEQSAKIIGIGSRADILNDLPEFDNDGNVIGHICIKIDVRPSDTSHLQNNLKEEGGVQEHARVVLENARVAGKNVGHVPDVIVHFETEEDGKKDEYLAMKTVRGKTLWRRIMEAAINESEGLNDHVTEVLKNERHQTFEQAIDKDLENILLSFYRLNEKEVANKIVELAKRNPFLKKEQYDQLLNTINELNDSHFFHRDMHSQNIMIGEDEDIYIIDFGTSTYDKDLNSESARHIGEGIDTDPDTSILPAAKLLIKYSASEKEVLETAELKRISSRGLLVLEQYGFSKEMNKKEFDDFLSNDRHGVYIELQSLTNMKNYDRIVELAQALSEAEKSLFGTTDKIKKYLEDNFVTKENKIRFNQAVIGRVFK